MRFFFFIINLPFTLLAIIPVLLSVPYSIKISKNPIAFILKVKRFWWAFGYMKHARAMTFGHVILMSPAVLKNDLEHEIIHVKQFDRYPFVFPLLYARELLKNGPRYNCFEDEAYKLSKSVYKGKQSS